jgi:type VI protein secretion system component VasF
MPCPRDPLASTGQLAQQQRGAAAMESDARNKSANDKEPYRPPAFNLFDWIVAAIGIALMVYVLLHLPAF